MKIIYIFVFLSIIAIFGICASVAILGIKGIQKRIEINKFKRNYYNTNLQQQQEIIELQKIQIEELKKQRGEKEEKNQ